MTLRSPAISGINLAPKLMKGPLFYSKILLFGEYGIIRDSKGLSIPYNFITVHWREMKILHLKLLRRMQV
jgi:hypothetical protein